MNLDELKGKKQSLRKLLNDKPAYFKYFYKKTVDSSVILTDFDNCAKAIQAIDLNYFYNKLKTSADFKERLSLLLKNALPDIKVELIKQLHKANIFILNDCCIMDAMSKLSSEQKYELLQLKNKEEKQTVQTIPEGHLFMILDSMHSYFQEKTVKLLKKSVEQEKKILKALSDRQTIRESLSRKKYSR